MEKKFFLTKVRPYALLAKFTLTLFTFCFFVLNSAQNVGDFKSVTNGNWNNVTTWKMWNGSAWVAAGNYPGQVPGKYTVTVSPSTAVTVNPALAVTIGDLYVQGTLQVQVNFTINANNPTPNLYINNGTILMSSHMGLYLPSGSNIDMNLSDPKTQGFQETGGCNGDTGVYIGGKKFSMCQGNAGIGDFQTLNELASSGIAVANATPSTVCVGNNVLLQGSKIGNASVTEVTWTRVSTPSNSTSTIIGTNGTNPSYSVNSGVLNEVGNYVFEFSFKVGGSAIFKDQVTVTVKPNMSVTSASSSPTLCINTALTPITHTTTGATGIGAATGLPAGVSPSWSVNKITLSGTPTAAGTFNYSIPLTGGCGSAYATGTITVTAPSSAGLPSSSPKVCVNTAIPTVSIATVGATGIGAATGLPAGVSPTWSGNTITLSGTPTASGTFNYSIPLTGGCGTASATGTITVTAPSSAGLPSSSPKVCVNTAIPTVSIATVGATGIGAATGLPAGVSASWAGNIITLSGTPTESGTFNYSIPLTGGCGNVSATGTIYVNLTSVFDGTNWSHGIPNENGLAAEIASDYNTSNGSLNACSCTVNAGKTLTISPNTFAKIENGIVNNGTIIVENDGNLIQVNDNAVNQGNVIVKRAFTFSPERKQYNYVSSPVVGGNLKTIYPGSPEAVYHSEATNMFYASSGANIQGRALALKEPSTAAVSGPTVTASFVGVPFNGILKYPLAYTTANPTVSHGYNLIGNPYPSDLDIDALYDDNNAKIDPTYSFWDNRGNTIFVQQGSAYNGANYTKYNAINGTGVPAGTPAAAGGPRIPNRFVKVGSGFMIRAKSTANGATLDFKNAYRSDNNSGPGFFGKSSTKDRYWLKLNTPGGIQLMTAVVYFSTGNNDFSLDDSVTSNSSDDIYTFAVQTAVAINGRAPFSQSDRVMVGVNSFTSGNYTISLGDQEGVFASGQNVYLKDHLTGIVTNLSEGSYTFSITAGQSTGRFELMYEPGAVLAAEGAVKDELMVYKDGQDFVVAAKASKITGLEVYDLLGRMIYKDAPQKTKATIDSSVMTTGVYIFRIDQGGKITTRKVIK